jgi:hypothetical protein
MLGQGFCNLSVLKLLFKRVFRVIALFFCNDSVYNFLFNKKLLAA